MNTRTLKSDILLFMTAPIWGFAFVAQRLGMESVGPFTFNAVRFALGCLVLFPVILITGRNRPALPSRERKMERNGIARAGLLAGGMLFFGASLQQAGLVYTTAGNAGFITGLYVVLVPIMGTMFGQKTSRGTWAGAVFAASGLYLLSVASSLTISPGDLLVLLGAFFWALHVLVIGRFSPGMDSFRLAFVQYAACSVLSFAAACLTEAITVEGLARATWPILYGGVISVGIAYTLQIVGQREAPSSHAAILMSLESVFAAIGGWLILVERLSPRQLSGCFLMLLGMLISQLWRVRLTGKGGGNG
jgi:drug/metabolite transporter (DMT)-like permease